MRRAQGAKMSCFDDMLDDMTDHPKRQKTRNVLDQSLNWQFVDLKPDYECKTVVVAAMKKKMMMKMTLIAIVETNVVVSVVD